MSKENYTETRPWGSFTILEETATYKVKRIVVKPGQRLSYQYHERRSENWTIVQGDAKVTLDENHLILTVGQSVHIPLRSRHRVENLTDSDLVFIEVQTGTYFGEDDIVRIEDDYKRQ